jgi:hypothetical protein
VRLVIPFILAAIRARIAAPLLRAQREAHSRELAKYGDRLTELAAEVRAADSTLARIRAALVHPDGDQGVDLGRAAEGVAIQLADEIQRVNMAYAKINEMCAPKFGPAVPEARRMAILGIVERWTAAMPIAPAARNISIESGGELLDALHGLSQSSVERTVSDLAREGWLVADGKKPRRYTLTEKGRAALRGDA